MKERQTTIMTIISQTAKASFIQQYDNLYMRIMGVHVASKTLIQDNKNPMGAIIKELNHFGSFTFMYKIEYINEEYLPYLLKELEDGKYRETEASKAIIEYAKEHEEK